jgi:threonine synthase
LEQSGDTSLCVSLETAHPAKFPEEIQKAIGIDPELPDSIKDLDEKTGAADLMNNDYAELRHYLLSQLTKKN